ncbi:MAG: biliverdin-producing heme oxygenase [Sphingopyxis sp.]|nr:biliverdin-producing heme oxygenase [Sphingopyxis sp.]
MQHRNIRSTLKSHTSDQHRKLDERIGEFYTVEDYACFVRQTHRFRGAAEAAMPTSSAWAVTPLLGLLADDLADLGEYPDAPPVFPAGDGDPAYWLGVAYVLEGSALGARLLVRRAAALGYTGTHGARHLVAQAADGARWRAFQAHLEAEPAVAQDALLTGAAATFDFALTIYATNEK